MEAIPRRKNKWVIKFTVKANKNFQNYKSTILCKSFFQLPLKHLFFPIVFILYKRLIKLMQLIYSRYS